MTLYASSPEQQQGILAALRAGLSPLRVDPPIRCNEWMIDNFRLSEENSQTPGGWVPYFFQIAIIDWMDDHNIAEFDWQKCARIGYTKVMVARAAFCARVLRRNLIVYQPTDADRDSFVKTEIEPMLRDMPVMRTVFPEFMRKSKSNTLSMKLFIGSVLHLLSMFASRNFRARTAAEVHIDELDATAPNIDGAGTADALGKKRMEGALYPKLICGSTARIKGTSHIERRVDSADAVMDCHIDCPSCGADHPIIFGTPKLNYGMKWEHRQAHTVHHVCPHCGYKLYEPEFRRIAPATWTWYSRCGTYRYGQDRTWRLNSTGEPVRPPRHVGVKSIWTAYSPQASWQQLTGEWFDAVDAKKKGNIGPFVQYTNETLSQTYEDDNTDKIESHELATRASRDPSPYKEFNAPQGVVVVVVAIDTQDNRWEAQWVGRGRDDETWVIGYKVIFGNPAEESEWDRMYAEVRAMRIQHASGAVLGIEGTGVDTQGHFTHQAYSFCRRHAQQRVFALRGNPKDGQPIKGKPSMQDINWRGRVIKSGIRLWLVGTDTAKDLIFGRLTKVTSPGPGYIHFPLGMPDEYYTGLTAEKRSLVRTARGFVTRWINPNHARNEPLDTMVYTEFVFHMLDLHRYSKAMWARREDALKPDLFSAQQQQPTDPKPDPLAALLPAPAPKKPAGRTAQPRHQHNTPRVW